MDEPKEKDSEKHGKQVLNPFAIKKPKKRSLVERELETNMTARVTSPVTTPDGVNTSRYGRARRIKTGFDKKVMDELKSPKSENTPLKNQSVLPKSVSNSSFKTETPKKALKTSLDNIDNICQDNKSLSSFSSEKALPKSPLPAKKQHKVYIRQDLIQNRDDDDDDGITLIKDLFSHKSKSGRKQGKLLESSLEKHKLSFSKQNGHVDNPSVVKTLNFDDNKKDSKGNKRDSEGNKKASDDNKKDSNGNKRDSKGNKKASDDNKRESDDSKRDSDGNNKDCKGNKKASDDNKTNSDNNNKKSDGNKIVSVDNKKESHDNKKDFDGNRRDSDDNITKNKNNDTQSAHKNELLKIEVTCPYQVGDLAWARMGTFPFWPCIITRDPESQLYVRKKLFGRVQHDILHVTFFADNGRRSWVVDNMLRKYMGLEEFLSAREKFTSEDKKKDPRLYSAFFISEKKQSLWNASVEEAEILNREPKELRIDIFNDLLYQARASKKQHKSGKVTRTDSDVSLSESLYDSLFSEDDTKTDDSNRSKNKSRNKSLDVSEVVTACLDNMAAKTGNIKIQRQSHMDRWLQKAKSKTPEKVKTQSEQVQPKTPDIALKIETVTPIKFTPHNHIIKSDHVNVEKAENPAPKLEKHVSNNKKKKLPPKEVKITKVYSLRRSYEPHNASNEQIDPKNHGKNKTVKQHLEKVDSTICSKDHIEPEFKKEITWNCGVKNSLDTKIDLPKDNTYTCNNEDNDAVLNAINELLEDTSTTASKSSLSKPSGTIGDSDKDLKVEPLTVNGNLAVKPEVMDVDEIQDYIVEGTDKLAVISEVILDSPVKTEKESLINVNLGRPVQIDCESPVKIEIESSIKTTSLTDPSIKDKQDVIEIGSNDVFDKFTHQTSTTLKCNEMVSIPENSHMTDDESESITSMDNTVVVDLQDHNINPTNISSMTINNIVDLTAKVIEDKSLDINSTIKQDILIKKIDINTTKPEESLINKDHENMSIDEIENEDMTINEKHPLNESDGSILQIDNDFDNVVSGKPEVVQELLEISLSGVEKSELLLNPSKNDALEVSSTGVKSNENTRNNNSESKSFLGDSLNIDVYKDPSTETDIFFLQKNTKPPHLTTESLAAKADLLQTVQNNDCDYDEDSDDEPSPEYEPLGDDITEDFRQHMKCIESNITDKKDEAQLVKVCYEIAVIEESKAKLIDIKLGMTRIDSSLNSSSEQNKRIVKDKIANSLSESVELNLNNEIVKKHLAKAKPIKSIETENIKVKSENVINDGTVQLNLINTDNNLVNLEENKAEILDGLNIIKKSVENNMKSPIDKKKHKLSLKKDKSRCEDTDTKQSIRNNTPVNPRYKTIDQIEEIIKSKPKKLPIENGEVCIPEIKENGYHTKREMDTPDRYDDDDFDIDDVSVNSEDSEVSIPQEKVPYRRILRSRPAKTGGLQDPEFLTYMELRKDDLMEEHPELSMDDIVLYLYKTYVYTQKLRSDVELDEPILIVNSVKQETPTSSRKKSKKSSQPKITIENFFRAKYNNAKKIDLDSESGTFDSNDDVKPKREMCSVSPVDSGIGNSKDSNESDSPYNKRKSLSKSPLIDVASKSTKNVKVEQHNDASYHKDASSPKTPKRLRKKTISPKVLGSIDSNISPKLLEKSFDKRVPVVVISPMKNKLIETINKTIKNELDTEPNHKTKAEAIYEPVTKMKPEPDTETKHPDVAAKPVAVVEHVPVTETKHKEVTDTKHIPDADTNHDPDADTIDEQNTDMKHELDADTESMDSDSELPLRMLRSKVLKENKLDELKKEILELKDEIEDTASVSSDNVPLLRLKPRRVDKSIEGSYEDPNFLKYLELKQDDIIDENPQLSHNEITAYLYKTWIYEKDSKSDIQKNDDIESSNLVKGLNQEPAPSRKAKRKPKTEKNTDSEEIIAKDKPKRKTVSHYYNEAFISDIEDELEIFEIFKTKKTPITVVSKPDSPKKEGVNSVTKTDDTLKTEIEDIGEEINTLDEIELYFKQLTTAKPSVFKGLIREKVCEICEDVANLVKCKGCNGSFHYDCVKTVIKPVEIPAVYKGRKKKKRLGRKPKNLDDSEHSDERDISIEMEDNISIEEIPEAITVDADTLEAQIEAKMKELLDKETQLNYDSYSSDDGIDWSETVPGKCELVDVKLKKRAPPIDYTNFKCNNCQKYDTPVCFVCKSAASKTGVKIRQNCNVAHCYNYYHLECLDHWPQTQFNAGEWTRGHKKTSEQLEALTCPRHVCHTCVSDDPRGCKTRFSGDKLAKCVRCPATYHSFNKCLPAGTQILTASLIICPRHYEHRPGKVPCHVNTGWCFICALGGSLICCEYCPTSFHAECLNIKPPEGNYMCEDCETGRLPLYEEMVWVKLGHYRWWPGVILHPSEIPENIMAVKHGLGEFVVRFFGQYDHYWVNRGRVFPYQEGDSGRISSQKSKIDLAFTTAMEHAQRAFEILKNAEPDDEESLDIASSLLPPHYVKLKCNKPIGSLLGRKIEDPSLSLTQCECNPAESEPCGPNSQCINRMLLTECGPTCRAGDRCSNRAFEKRLYPKLTPYRASHRGWGLKTLEDIKAGQFVIEYVGELIDEEEFQRRMRRKHEIRDENFYFLTLDKERMIDAGPKGNLARFMNHCCEPNCETQKWTVLGDIRVGLFAIDDIMANSEVTFNYNLECTGIEKKRCMCGANRCSGYIGAKPKQLDESQRKKNGNITGKRKYTKRKNMEDSPNAIKIKVKRPIGRPPKPKELTEIEKDLLIINSATVSSGESRCQSVEEKNLKPLKKKEDTETTEQGSISSTENTVTKESRRQSVEDKNLKPLHKEDSNATEQGSVLSTENTVTKLESTHQSVEEKNLKPLTKKADSNSTEHISILNTENTVTKLESKSQSIEEKNLKPLKRKDSNTTAEGPISNTGNTVTKIHSPVSNPIDSKSLKLKDSSQEVPILNDTMQAVSILNGVVSRTLKRKLDSNTSEEVTILSAEPIAKRHKSKQIEVGD